MAILLSFHWGGPLGGSLGIIGNANEDLSKDPGIHRNCAPGIPLGTEQMTFLLFEFL